MGFYTGFLYGHGIQSILLCVLTVALSIASAPTTDCSLALSLHADLPVVLTIVHFNGTSILSLHTKQSLQGRRCVTVRHMYATTVLD
jgi:hypothetical protein